MEFKPGIGIGDLQFGYTPKDLRDKVGLPDRTWEDEDDSDQILHQYNRLRSTATFYEDEGNKLGYIRCSDPSLKFQDELLIGAPLKVVLALLGKELGEFKLEGNYTFFNVYFNEEYWISINEEYGFVTMIELGVPLSDSDDYVWPAKDS